MYGIIQIKNNKEKIITLINGKENFQQQVEAFTLLKLVDEVVEGRDCLIKDNEQYVVISKVINESKGYIWNSTTTETTEKKRFRLVEYDEQPTIPKTLRQLCQPNTPDTGYRKMETFDIASTIPNPKLRSFTENTTWVVPNKMNESDIIKVDDGTGKPLPISKFNMNNMCIYPHILIIGKRGSGKTRLIYDYLDKNNIIDNLTIFCPTSRFNKTYEQYENATIYYQLNTEIIKNIMDDQRKNSSETHTIILDDCLSSKGGWTKDPIMIQLLYDARHHKINLILAMQFPMSITPELRHNFDYVFLSADDFISNQKRLYDHYAGMFSTFTSFKKTFEKLSNNYQVMAIDQRLRSHHFLDKISWYKTD